MTILSIDERLVKEAAEIRSDYAVSYADAFCIATAQRSGGHFQMKIFHRVSKNLRFRITQGVRKDLRIDRWIKKS